MLNFLQGLDNDLNNALLTQFRNLWTHTSTAIEGNTLTLGETAFVLKESLAISGKPLKDHEEVVGHAKAIDLIYELVDNKISFAEKDLFSLHKAVQTKDIVDVYKPIGGWKKEPNSTVAVVDDKQVVFEYSSPGDVALLMKEWFELYHSINKSVNSNDKQQALMAYARLQVSFVRIHPFFDGNGRMARLISNIPVLQSGLPPIIIPREQRKQYIDSLSAYHFLAGQIKAGDDLLPNEDALKPFLAFCENAWEGSLALVEDMHIRQLARE
jgi:Fic family protein